MNLLTAAAKGLAIGFWALMVDYFFIAMLSHRYQRETPGVWREETPRHYAAATAVHFVWGSLLAVGFTYFRPLLPVRDAQSALALGTLFWLFSALPVLLSVGVFVNWHKFVWLALIADWLVILSGGTLIAYWLL